MAKKKLNKVVAASIVTVLITAGGAGVGYYVMANRIRPKQNYEQGVALLKQGDYAGAFEKLSRAVHSYGTDMEFQGRFFESVSHRTSFDDDRLPFSAHLLDTALAAKPNSVPILKLRVQLALDQFEVQGVEPADPDVMVQQATTILASDPNDPIANRAVLLGRVLKLNDATSATTTADIETAVGELRALADAQPNNPDRLNYFAQVSARQRESMVRDQAISASPDTDVAKGIFADLDARVTAMRAGAAETAATSTTQPALDAEQRGRMFLATANVDYLLIQSRLVPAARQVDIGNRMLDSFTQAARTMPPTAPLYSNTVAAAADVLERVGRFDDAEKMLTDAVNARPELWSSRIALAEFLGRRGRPAEALATLNPKPELGATEKLAGAEGARFLGESRYVPIRRALFRVQAMDANARAGGDPTTRPDRTAEIAAARADYNLGITHRPNENDPSALQAMSAIQEASGDRSAAAETLRRAVDVGSVSDLQLRQMLRHLVDLNLGIGQPGRAADVLDRLVQMSPPSQDIIQLLDLRIRNNQLDQANAIVTRLQQMMPNSPIVALAQAKLATTPEAVRAALAKVPDDNPQMASAKFAVAMNGGAKDVARDVAKRSLATTPDNIPLAAQYIDMLVADNQKDEALKVVDAAIAKQPNLQSLKTIRATLTAGSTAEAASQVGESITDPYQRALFEAGQVRSSDAEGYIAKLHQAMTLDTAKDGTAAERLFLFLLSTNRLDDAQPVLDALKQTKRDPATIRAHTARLAIARGKPDDALPIADALVRELPDFAPGWIVKGESHQLKQQYDQAATAFDAALRNRPGDSEALRGAIDTAEHLGLSDRMRSYIDTALRASNNDPYFVDRSLKWELTYGDPIKTIGPREAAQKASPDDPSAWLSLAQSYSAAYRAKKTAHDDATAEDFRKKAYDLLSQATAKFPKAPGFPLQAAELAVQGGDVPTGLKIIDAMEQTPGFVDEPQVQYVRAEFYLEHGQADRGKQMLAALIASGKGGDPARLRFAELQANANDVNGALATLDAAPQRTDAITQARFNLLLSGNRVDDAIKMADEQLAKQRSVPNLLMKALALASKQDMAGALKLADEAVTQNPDDPAAHVTRARIAMNQHPVRNADVIADLEAVRKVAPGNADARLLLAGAYRAAGRATESMTELETVQREQPGNIGVVQQLVNAYLGEEPVRTSRIENVIASAKNAGLANDPQLLALDFQVAMQGNDAGRAVAAAGAWLKAQPDNLEAFRGLLNALIRGQQFAQVLTELDRIEKSNGTLYWTYLTRGVALHNLKRDAEAAPQFDRAISIATSLRENAPPLTEIAGTYAQQYGADAAADWLKQKLPGNPEALALSVSLYTREAKFQKAVDAGTQLMPVVDQLSKDRQTSTMADLGTACLASVPPDARKARQAFEQFLKVDPENAMILNNLAYTLTLDGSGGDLGQATQVAKHAYDLSSASGTEDPFIMDTYGWTLVQAGQTKDGIDILQRARTIKRLPEIEYHLGVALTTQQDRAGAVQSLQNALDIIKQAEETHTTVDASLKSKVTEAMARAKLLDAN